MTFSLSDPVSLPHGPDLPNRFALAPLTNVQSHADGTLSDDEYEWLVARGRGGFGLTMTCAAFVSAAGQAWSGQLGISEDAHLPGLRRLAEGDAQALAPLYQRESPAVYRYALALCGNAAWAADAVQEAFLQLMQRPQGFDPARGSLGAYLAGTVRHRLLAQWREPAADLSSEDDRPVEGDGSPETLLVRRQHADAVWDAIRALPWPFREALILVDLQDRPYAEAAQIAGVELNTLRTRLHRARQRLARSLGAGEKA